MRFLFLCLMVLVAGRSIAACVDKEATSEQLTILKSGQYKELESLYQGIQRAYEAGMLPETKLVDDYDDLYSPFPESEKYFSQWVNSYPQSYAAHVARGAYYYNMAEASRGCDFIQETADRKIRQMNEYLSLSYNDIEYAMRLSKKPYVAALELMLIAALDGGSPQARQYFEMANHIDPDNWYAKKYFMRFLTPRWGGSREQMWEFLGQCRQWHVSPEHLRVLESLIYFDMADYYESKDNYLEWGRVLVKLKALSPQKLMDYL